MARKVTHEFMVYTYPELSETAQEKVREWWNRVQWDDGVAAESMTMIFEYEVGERLGWEVDPKSLTFSLYSQGGYPEWSGTLREWEHGGKKWTVVTRNPGSYTRSMSVSVEPEWETDDEPDRTDEETRAAEDAAQEMVGSISSDLFWKFRAEDEYLSSDEQVRETCEANGYEFTEEGDLA